ncbi:GMC family oxidoreductase [candidate division KSB1 bacterium]|nr:GMC family oxidoreductase [candidate division KSB1 bacterium]NIR68687.1 GMC family oxidoreductase [candidate division KSB1 bacterium]NIS25504.1 GMC family oxidoreductase [candidate division KSB1 bacterium]NIT72397.1 GMC family oxidoreductase [candidate division KSB1 bacterium]NIU26181.1 GMC family oxidoreductase [candidate division KSB1 bacterium]
MSVDVCIIGSGEAGGLVASELARAGKSVVLLESGPRFDLSDPFDRYELVLRGRNPWPWLEHDRDEYETKSEMPLSLNTSRIKAVGGTTLSWNAYAPRPKPEDFKMFSLFGWGVDWPLTYDELEPYFVRAEAELGVAGAPAPGDPNRSAPYPLRPHPFSYADQEIFKPAFENLGLELGANPIAINSEDHSERPTCQGFGTCHPMCPIDAKYTSLAHIERAEATGNLKVKANSHVRRFRLGSKRNVAYAEFVNASGELERQEANYFVIAAGGVETPRLLLLSDGPTQQAKGLGNSSGLVGRNFILNTLSGARGSLPIRTGSHRLSFGTSISWTLYDHSNLPEMGNLLIFPSDFQGPTPADMAVSSGLWGQELKSHVKETFGHNVKILCESEMVPNPENRVRLSARQKDKYGDAIPVLELHLSQFEHATMDRAVELGYQILDQVKAVKKWPSRSVMLSHAMGTTRMGDDPKTSVCDGWGRCHDLDNLYVASSSLFPTSGAAHPAMGIAALTLRTADFLTRNI